MKSLILIIIILGLIFTHAYGQVGIGTNDPDACAALEVESTSGGILFPRLTTSQIFYIDGPEPGLVVYNMDSLDLWIYDGNRWRGVNDAADTLNPLSWYCGIDNFYQGKYYMTVLIGSQCWMAENLAVTKYNDGTAIPLVTGDAAWEALTSPGRCWFDNDSASYAEAYGALYNYYAVADTNSRNVCPEGWHVPSDAEWTTLTTYLGGEGVAGGKMKSTRTVPDPHPRWNSPNTGATNESGFTGLPGGYREIIGSFHYLGSYGYFWSSSPYTDTSAWNRKLSDYNDDVYRKDNDQGYGFSLRCLQD